MHSDTLLHQLSVTGYVIKKNIEGLTHDDSLKQPSPGGSTLNWVVGHVVRTRNLTLPLVGKEQVIDPARLEMYKDEPLSDPAGAVRLEELLEMYDALEKPLFEGIRNMSADVLSSPAPFSPTGNPDETVGSLLAGIAFHEAYHAGQTGLLRRLTGKPGAIKAPR